MTNLWEWLQVHMGRPQQECLKKRTLRVGMTVLAVACQLLSRVALAHGYMDVSHFKHNVRAEFDQPNVLLILIVSVIVVSFSNTRMGQTYPPGPLNNENMILDIYNFSFVRTARILSESRQAAHP